MPRVDDISHALRSIRLMDAGWPLRCIGLKVADVGRVASWYRRLGMQVRDQTADGAALGFGGEPVIRLRRTDGARAPRAAGLFHIALLLPDEAALGGFLRRIAEQDVALDGAADHLVSAALYLHDPEGNGVEVYADRPRDAWTWRDGRVHMVSDPLDLAALAAKSSGAGDLPAESGLGHVHFTTQDPSAAREFFESDLGMQSTAGWPAAQFLSWDGYHHHVAANVFDGPATRPAQEHDLGVDYVEVVRPDLHSGERVSPDGVRFLVVRA